MFENCILKQGASLLPALNKKSRLLNVQNHLVNLLNTRQGSLMHQPDYGLPDLTSIYQNLPESLNYLIAVLHKTVSRFETRISDLEIVCHPTQYKKFVVCLEFHGYVSNQPISLSSYFHSGGGVELVLE